MSDDLAVQTAGPGAVGGRATLSRIAREASVSVSTASKVLNGRPGVSPDTREIVERLLQRAQTEGRTDDTEDVIRRRQEVYSELTEPLIGVYRERGILIEVDGMGEVDDVTSRIFAALDIVPES